MLLARRQVDLDLIAVDRARRALDPWRVTEKEIREIEDGALRTIQR